MDIALASLLNIASLGGLHYLFQRKSQEKEILQEIEASKVYSPHKLLTSFQSPIFLAKAKRNMENPDEFAIKAFLEGSVECEKPITSIINKKEKLVHRVYFCEDLYSNDRISRSEALLSTKKEGTEISAPMFFNIKDPLTKDRCLIHRSIDVHCKHALEEIEKRERLKELNWFESILYLLGLMLDVFGTFFVSSRGVRGIKIGWTEKEFGIRVNSALTIYGEIIYNIKEKSLRIDSPLYYVTEKSNILNDLKREIGRTTAKIFLLAIPLICSSWYLISKARAFYRRMKAKRIEEGKDKLKNVTAIILKDDYRCINCLNRPRNVIYKPCLHFVLCSVCNTDHKTRLCPVCNVNIEDNIEIFFS